MKADKKKEAKSEEEKCLKHTQKKTSEKSIVTTSTFIDATPFFFSFFFIYVCICDSRSLTNVTQREKGGKKKLLLQ